MSLRNPADTFFTNERFKNSRFALLSVTNKSGIIRLGEDLEKSGFTLLSTGGTAKVLRDAGRSVVDVAEYTGYPECMEGRLKTLHPLIEGGILYNRGSSSHVDDAQNLGIRPIDVVVCNLYPFVQVTRDPNVSLETAVENIDIGGPTMLRAAAKNWEHVVGVVDVNDYYWVGRELNGGGLTRALKFILARKIFEHAASYDMAIARYLNTISPASLKEDSK